MFCGRVVHNQRPSRAKHGFAKKTRIEIDVLRTGCAKPKPLSSKTTFCGKNPHRDRCFADGLCTTTAPLEQNTVLREKPASRSMLCGRGVQKQRPSRAKPRFAAKTRIEIQVLRTSGGPGQTQLSSGHTWIPSSTQRKVPGNSPKLPLFFNSPLSSIASANARVFEKIPRRARSNARSNALTCPGLGRKVRSGQQT